MKETIEEQILLNLRQPVTPVTPENIQRVRSVINWFNLSGYKTSMTLAHELVDEFQVARRGNRKPLSDWLESRMNLIEKQ